MLVPAQVHEGSTAVPSTTANLFVIRESCSALTLIDRYHPFKRTQECRVAVDMLKKRLCSSPVLCYPDYKRPFLLDTDASGTGIGAVLSQVDLDGKE